MKRTVTTCDVCDRECSGRNMRELRGRFRNWGDRFETTDVRHVCQNCWERFLEWATDAGREVCDVPVCAHRTEPCETCAYDAGQEGKP